jgi:hypothetical protein
MVDFKALAALAAAQGADMTKAVVGGGDYKPPVTGPGFCRFIGYVELGKQTSMMKGKQEVKEKVMLIFELVSKRHLTGNDEQPHRVTITETLSLNEKANFFKLFSRMNYAGAARHMAELLGEGFKCEVFHDEWTGSDGKPQITTTFKGPAGYSIMPPWVESEESKTGWAPTPVPSARSDIRCFIWQHADMAQWQSLFIEGEYPERKAADGKVTPAKSKNVLQNKVKAAKNFVGSPMHQLLLAGGAVLDLPAVGENMEREPAGLWTDQLPDSNPVQHGTSNDDSLAGIV